MAAEEVAFDHREFSSILGWSWLYVEALNSTRGFVLDPIVRSALFPLSFLEKSTSNIDTFARKNSYWFQLVDQTDFFRYIAYLVWYPLVIIQFILHCFSDPLTIFADEAYVSYLPQ